MPHQNRKNRPPRGEYAEEKPYASSLIAMIRYSPRSPSIKRGPKNGDASLASSTRPGLKREKQPSVQASNGIIAWASRRCSSNPRAPTPLSAARLCEWPGRNRRRRPARMPWSPTYGAISWRTPRIHRAGRWSRSRRRPAHLSEWPGRHDIAPSLSHLEAPRAHMGLAAVARGGLAEHATASEKREI